MEAVFFAHNGNGDLLMSNGIVRFLLDFYTKVHVVGKNVRGQNVYKLAVELFKDEKRVIVHEGNTHGGEFTKNLHARLDKGNVDLVKFSYCRGSIIRNTAFIEALRSHKNKSVFKYDFGIYSNHFDRFCSETGIDRDIIVDRWHFPHAPFDFCDIGPKKIAFLHLKSSTHEAPIPEMAKRYFLDHSYVVICPDRNLYELSHPNRGIAEKFVWMPIMDYCEVISKCSVAIVADSCFSCILMILKMRNEAIAPEGAFMFVRQKPGVFYQFKERAIRSV